MKIPTRERMEEWGYLMVGWRRRHCFDSQKSGDGEYQDSKAG